MHYNYYRDYEPRTGRYIEPDPIGVRGLISTFGSYNAKTGMYKSTAPMFFQRQSNLFEYVQNNPINMTDRLGLWTFGFGAGATGGAGAGASGSGMIVVDGKGNIGVLTSGGAGGYGGVSGSVGGIIQVTNADTIYDLKGWSSQTGGSYGQGTSYGVELIIGKGYMGFNINVGIGGGLTAVEQHSIVEYAGVSGVNIFDLLNYIEDLLRNKKYNTDCQ